MEKIKYYICLGYIVTFIVYSSFLIQFAILTYVKVRPINKKSFLLLKIGLLLLIVFTVALSIIFLHEAL